jgi:hypothetical protein
VPVFLQQQQRQLTRITASAAEPIPTLTAASISSIASQLAVSRPEQKVKVKVKVKVYSLRRYNRFRGIHTYKLNKMHTAGKGISRNLEFNIIHTS